MYKTPLISIIVPVFKAEKYLSDCLNSILSQTFSDFELILVNDGSTDNSGIICDLYSSKDHRIKVIHKPNGGASTARKAGLEVARGKYIGWVDADDRIAPDMFSTLYALAESYNADIAECQLIKIRGDEKNKIRKEEPVVFGSGDFILKQFFCAKMIWSFCNKLYKTKLFANLEFPKRQFLGDIYVNMHLALMPLTYVRTSESKYYYIVRENSLFTTYNALAIREAIYLYDYTLNLSTTVASTALAKNYLFRDAIPRLMERYFTILANSNIKNQNVYNHFIRKKLGQSLVKYLLLYDMHLHQRISYILFISNLKSLQVFLHKHFGKRSN